MSKGIDRCTTLAEVVAMRAAATPDVEAVTVDGRGISYRQLHLTGNRVANGLGELGVCPGDCVALLMTNSVAFLQTWVGLTAGGFVEVPLNVALRGALLADQLRRSGAVVVVVDESLRHRIGQVRDDLPALRHVISVGVPSNPSAAGEQPFWLPFEQLLAGSADPPEHAPDAAMASSIMFTSGTTGPSKGAVRSHRADFTLARQTVEIMGYGPEDVLFSAFPLYHLNAKFNSVLATMLCGARLVLHDRFSASTFWDTCRAEGVTAFNFMGALLTMLLKQPETSRDQDHAVRCAYGAPAPEPLLRPFEDRFGVTLVEVYGSTELGIATMNTVDDRVVGSSGRAAPHFDVRIHDPQDRAVPAGTTGEICVRPRRPGVMFDGYHDMAAETVMAMRNLWFHTGDRAWLDEEDCLHFVDRMKDAVRRRGENISSFEVEKVLSGHPDVAACAVIGVPDEVSGEEVAAFVIPQPGTKIDPADLLDHCQTDLSHFAVPRYVVVVDDLPRTPSQRVEKYRLRQAGLPADTWDRTANGYEVVR